MLESPKIRQFRHHCHLAARIPVRNPHGHGCRPGSRKHEIHICRRITITSRVKITRLLLGAGSRSLTIPHIGFRSHPWINLPWIVPHGFPISHPRTLANGLLPSFAFAGCLWASIACGRRRPIAVPFTAALPGLGVGLALGCLALYPYSMLP